MQAAKDLLNFHISKKKPTEDCEWALAVPVSSKSDQTNP